jgi:hypothetical protein
MQRKHQRDGAACVGAGNGDPAADGAAAAGLLGFFGRIGFRSGFGGTIGCSCAITGLGSILVVPGVMKPAGLPLTCTGIVTGWKFSRV